MIFRTTSHRSRHNLDGVLGGHPQYYFTFEQGGCFVKLDDPAQIERALKIKGISKCRCQDDSQYMKCLETGIKR